MFQKFKFLSQTIYSTCEQYANTQANILHQIVNKAIVQNITKYSLLCHATIDYLLIDIDCC